MLTLTDDPLELERELPGLEQLRGRIIESLSARCRTNYVQGYRPKLGLSGPRFRGMIRLYACPCPFPRRSDASSR
jgi:hypothetical protein